MGHLRANLSPPMPGPMGLGTHLEGASLPYAKVPEVQISHVVTAIYPAHGPSGENTPFPPKPPLSQVFTWGPEGDIPPMAEVFFTAWVATRAMGVQIG